MRLKPNRIPQWIVSNPIHQACAKWIGDDVSGRFLHVSVITNRSFVKTGLPKLAGGASLFVDRNGASGFYALEQARQRPML